MKNLAIFSLVSLFLCGCETTGNPREGGIFWSERKAQERLQQKRSELSRIEADTARRRRSSDN